MIKHSFRFFERQIQTSTKCRLLEDELLSAEIKQKQGIPISGDLAHDLVLECWRNHDVNLARRVQSIILHHGLDSIGILANHLIRVFSSCESLVEANQAFQKVTRIDCYTWNAIITANAQLGKDMVALHLCESMWWNECAEPNKYILPSILKACTGMYAKEKGRYIHELIIESRLQSDTFVANALIDMYGKCGSLEEAEHVFDGLQNRDVVSWSAMVAAYAQNGEGHVALDYFQRMQKDGAKPSKVTFLGLLKACTTIGTIEKGRCIHEEIIESGLQFDVVIGSTIVDMYAKCKNMEEACWVLYNLPSRNVVSWNAMIAGYAQQGQNHLALDCLKKMQNDGIRPNVASWNSVIAGYVQNRRGELALECFDNMESEGTKPDKITFSTILKGCGSAGATAQGRYIHEQVIANGLQSDIIVGSSLVDMYGKCGCLIEASRAFSRLSSRDVISWHAMIAGYGQHGNAGMAAQCFEDMQHYGIKPDNTSFISILAALSRAGLVDEALQYFKFMIKNHGIQPGTHHITSIADALGRAGHLNKAEELLKANKQADICQFKSLLSACNIYSNEELGKRCFDAILQLNPHCAPAYVLMRNIMLVPTCHN